MPTVLRIGGFKFYFYSHEPDEPPHIHIDIDRENMSAKYWLDPVGLARNIGFSPKELRKIEKLVKENQKILLEAWNGYFGFECR